MFHAKRLGTEHPFARTVLVLLLTIYWGVLNSPEGALAEGGNAGRVIVFDIPAQPLISALDAYGAATGLEVLYDSSLAAGRQSTEVKGAYTARAALSLLLRGSDLMVRFLSTGAITLAPSRGRRSASFGPPPESDPHRAYFAMIQTSFEMAFCQRGGMNLGRIILRFGIGPSGTIEQPEVLDSLGNDRRNRMIAEALQHVTLVEPPPPDLSQPIIMLISPQSVGSTGKCSTTN